jgi:DNA-binding transcriptional MocR family regulator
MKAQAPHRYEQLADLIVGMIDKGALSPGMRVPSVRAVSAQHRLSIATALQAYRMLEDRGVLVARPQSGFYVSDARPATFELPSTSRPRTRASAVSLGGAVAVLLEHASNMSLVPLGCAVPDAGLLQSKPLDLALARVARQHGARHNVYSAPRGEAALRREIARRSMQAGHALSPDDILVTSGCTEALTLALGAVARPGDTIAVESPTYFGLLHTLEVLGLKALELATDPVRGVDVAALARVLDKETVAACVLSSGFSNPLGCVMAESDKRALLALLSKHAIPLIEDDVYGDIHFGRERPTPFIALDRGENRIIYCSSFSKSLAPGYRVGWIAPGAYAQRVLDRKLAFNLGCPVLPQLAIAEFLEGKAYDVHLRRLRRVLEDNLARMVRAIEASFPAETKVSRPTGRFMLWLELPRHFDARALFEDALEQGICFAPGDVFSASRRYGHCLRLSAGHAWNDRIEAGVRRLGRMARERLAPATQP